MLTVYLVGAVATMILFATLNEDTPVREVATISVFWPISYIFMGLVFMMDWAGWDIDVKKGAKLFGFRQRYVGRGFEVTILSIAFQFWKAYYIRYDYENSNSGENG